jgi:hypothetical protein
MHLFVDNILNQYCTIIDFYDQSKIVISNIIET